MSPESHITDGIRVEVESRYSAERSAPMRGFWFFAYTVTITNEGEAPARLLRRHWIITDAEGHVEEVEGAGVVGETPHLGPGETFSYTSGCPLRTPFGTMRGTFQLARDDGRAFTAEIPGFALLQPNALN